MNVEYGTIIASGIGFAGVAFSNIYSKAKEERQKRLDVARLDAEAKRKEDSEKVVQAKIEELDRLKVALDTYKSICDDLQKMNVGALNENKELREYIEELKTQAKINDNRTRTNRPR